MWSRVRGEDVEPRNGWRETGEIKKGARRGRWSRGRGEERQVEERKGRRDMWSRGGAERDRWNRGR